MNLEINSQAIRRHNIRKKLQGTLNAWKLNLLEVGQTKQIDIKDRTPVRGVTKFTFDDGFMINRKIGMIKFYEGEGASGSVYTC